MQYKGAGEVAACRYGCYAGDDLRWFGGEKTSKTPVISSLSPLCICFGDVNWAVKGLRPAEMGGVVVRVGDNDGFESALLFDPGYGWLVKESEAVP